MDYIEAIKQIPIDEFAERLGYTTVSRGSRYVSLREHDSVMIDRERNAFWRNSRYQRGQKGAAGSIIDFAVEFCGCDQKQAIQFIGDMYGLRREDYTAENKMGPMKQAREYKPVKKEFTLPPKAEDNRAVIRYLCAERKIDISVVMYFIRHGYLYQDVRRNCVFKTEKFACKRSTGSRKFAGDVEGCDYSECFFIRPNEEANTLVVCEGVIDVMSVMHQLMAEGLKYTAFSYLALAGTGKLPALFNQLKNHPAITNVVMALDGDESGMKATALAEDKLVELGYNGRFCVAYAPDCKDWNEFVQSGRKDAVLAPLLKGL